MAGGRAGSREVVRGSRWCSEGPCRGGLSLRALSELSGAGCEKETAARGLVAEAPQEASQASQEAQEASTNRSYLK